VFNILKRESTIPPNEKIIRHNICNVELQPNICYGRGVGYKLEEIVLPEKIQDISATKIRQQLRDQGKLK